jgi:hypothetical protein
MDRYFRITIELDGRMHFVQLIRSLLFLRIVLRACSLYVARLYLREKQSQEGDGRKGKADETMSAVQPYFIRCSLSSSRP